MDASFTVQFNEGVRKRAAAMLGKTLDKLVSMGVNRTGNLFRKARYRVKYRDNEADLIQLIMPRYGFVQMSKGGIGSSVTSFGGKRSLSGGMPRPFMYDAVDEDVDPLADWVAEMHADKAVDVAQLEVVVRR